MRVCVKQDALAVLGVAAGPHHGLRRNPGMTGRLRRGIKLFFGW